MWQEHGAGGTLGRELQAVGKGHSGGFGCVAHKCCQYRMVWARKDLKRI